MFASPSNSHRNLRKILTVYSIRRNALNFYVDISIQALANRFHKYAMLRDTAEPKKEIICILSHEEGLPNKIYSPIYLIAIPQINICCKGKEENASFYSFCRRKSFLFADCDD